MPHSPQIQLDRQGAIRKILTAGPAAAQHQLVDELLKLGFDATRSCVSRDLWEIGT